jgi:hypothetical protein
LVATYAGSKAFLQVFAESLWFELRPHGIQVLGLILGTTKTPAMERVGLVFDEAVHRPMESDDAAQEGLDHLADGPTWIAGKQNRKFGDILRTSDRRQMVEMMSNVAMTVAPKIRAKSNNPEHAVVAVPRLTDARCANEFRLGRCSGVDEPAVCTHEHYI